ncbi:jg22400 [Pararge aegeria aegeria]|uniref:Jg22400 protein n=1 Tax=Pararge aegeria aegeria TaxID=348720 RepID=A0A8S4QMI8_9NEOP|nr:jg22400 [Pararge aegeria aegeria]
MGYSESEGSKSLGNALRSGGRECQGAMLRMCGCTEASARANMVRARRVMNLSRSSIRKSLPMIEFLTYRGALVSFLRASDCWALKIFLFVSLASANHAGAAYVRMVCR